MSVENFVPEKRLLAALFSRREREQQRVIPTIKALGQAEDYAGYLLGISADLKLKQRAVVGESTALLDDPRFITPYFLSEMLPVPGGEVVLGSDECPEEQPVHRVSVKRFSLAKYPVTQAAYGAFAEATRYKRQRAGTNMAQPESKNKPVVFISFRDAEAYCDWLSSETGFDYRLPTEAEWALAARGADSTRIFPWGDAFEPVLANAWGRKSIKELCAVGLFPAGRGPYGHDDLAGNVWEWCASLFWPYPYVAEDGRENTSASNNRQHVLHGGSWRSKPFSVRCNARQGELPTDSFKTAGFRIARDEG